MPPKVDKKLAKKLAKMTEEERAAFLEQQRLQEEEAQKKKEEMLLRFLKDKLAKEEKASKLNMVKLQDRWRTIMRKGKQDCYISHSQIHNHIYKIDIVKTEELGKDLKVMSQTFERTVDRKNAIIQSLMKDLEESEEQYQVALRTHLHEVDDMIGES